MVRGRLIAGWLGLMTWSVSASAQTPAQVAQLTRARQAYNLAQYDQAIAAGSDARQAPALAAAASLVIGRAHLERFRLTSDGADLTAAHQMLGGIDPAALRPPDQRDLTIGLGLTVFFEGRPGAAAELLEVALAAPADVATDARAREKLFDWWATAVDRAAQLAPDAGRVRYYERILARTEIEMARDPASYAAGYWMAAAARGAGEFDRAWDAAIAAWIRARTAPPLGNTRDARGDARLALDLLMTTAIIPERARAIDARAVQPLVAAMLAEWEQIKGSW
jgi:hypothetical protein